MKIEKLPVKINKKTKSIEIGKGYHTVKISFHKTIRVPDDGRIHPLPVSLTSFLIYIKAFN